MPIRYINRKDVAWQLRVGKTRSGRPNYYVVQEEKLRLKKKRKPTDPDVPRLAATKGAPLDAIPEGYEIYERPDTAQVLLRKIPKTNVTPEEREAVENAVYRLAQLSHFVVHVEDDAIVVYLPMNDVDGIDRLLDVCGVAGSHRDEFRESSLQRACYHQEMRFRLVDVPNRIFAADRWDHSGFGVWRELFMMRSRPLGELIPQCVPHLGKESFFELM